VLSAVLTAVLVGALVAVLVGALVAVVVGALVAVVVGALTPVLVAAEARALVTKILRVRLVDGTQVVHVLGAGAFLSALVGGQQGLAEPGQRAALGRVPRPDLSDDIGQCDPERQPMGTDRCGAEYRPALITDDGGDLCRGASRDQVLRPDAAGYCGLLPSLAISCPRRI
jgi:hypothetical protein